jgi:hypothetical protein
VIGHGSHQPLAVGSTRGNRFYYGLVEPFVPYGPSSEGAWEVGWVACESGGREGEFSVCEE